MDNFTDKQILYLAALLHDVGKIYSEQDSTHFTSYIDDIFDRINEVVETDNLPRVKKIVKQFFQDNDSEDRLVSILKKAHHSLTGEKKVDITYVFHPLESVFAHVNLGDKHDGEERYYLPGEFIAENTIPVNKKKVSERCLTKLRNGFLNELQTFKKYTDINSFLIFIHAISKKYFWSVPASTTATTESLYDHLKLTAAISTVLYDVQEAHMDEGYLMVGGDLSGIQEYIYDIASVGQKKVAKRLRARSFFISILTDVVLHKILHKLDLQEANVLIATGGKFVLLVPNTIKSREFLKSFNKELNEWFFKEFQGQLYFNLCQQSFSGDVFNSFSRVYDNLNDKLSESKKQKFQEILNEDEDYIFDDYYSSDSVPCISCKKLWQSEQSEELCAKCLSDERIGKYLVKSKYIAFSIKKPEHENYLSFFNHEQYYLSFIVEKDLLDKGEYYLIYNLIDSEILSGYPADFKFYANYVPVFNDVQEKEPLCENCQEKNCNLENVNNVKKQPYSFSCLALASVDDKRLLEDSPGLKSLGVLKADVDNLGAIFSIGLGERKSNIASITSLSRMINYFFAGLLQQKFLEGKVKEFGGRELNLRLNYIVYAGGDDLLIVGPWDNMILTIGYIRELFSNYCTNNPNITLSAGVSIVKSNYPIARSSELAGEQEEKAKNGGRNSLSIFDKVVTWDKYFDYFLKTIGKLEGYLEKGVLSSAFLYRLFNYYNMNQQFLETRDAKYLKWVGYYRYDVARNIKVKSKKDQKKQELLMEAQNFLQEIVLNTDCKGNYNIKDLKLPLNWVVYRNK